MLVTTCTNCQARFRVTPQQLNEKQGQVRCGRCRKVFNGFEALERFPDDDTGTRLLAQREAAERGLPAPAVEAAPEEDLPEIESVGSTPPIAVDLPVSAEPAAEPPIDPALAPPDAPPPEPPWSPSEPMAAPEPAPPEPSTAPPGRRGRASREPALTLEPPPRKRVARAWSFGVVLLALVLALEGTFAMRVPLAQRYPVIRPPLEAACAQLGCTVPYSRQEGLLKLEESDMQEVPGKPNEIALGARLRNLAGVAQEYPFVELTLTDFSGQPAARRVLRPTDYLGRPVRAGEVVPAGGEITLQLRIETPGLKPTGYELFLFYP